MSNRELPNEFILRPAYMPQVFNGSNEPCDMLVGSCACGAWHNNAAMPDFGQPPKLPERIMFKELDPPGTNLDAVRQILKVPSMEKKDIFAELDDLEKGGEVNKLYIEAIRQNFQMKLKENWWQGFWFATMLWAGMKILDQSISWLWK